MSTTEDPIATLDPKARSAEPPSQHAQDSSDALPVRVKVPHGYLAPGSKAPPASRCLSASSEAAAAATPPQAARRSKTWSWMAPRRNYSAPRGSGAGEPTRRRRSASMGHAPSRLRVCTRCHDLLLAAGGHVTPAQLWWAVEQPGVHSAGANSGAATPPGHPSPGQPPQPEQVQPDLPSIGALQAALLAQEPSESPISLKRASTASSTSSKCSDSGLQGLRLVLGGSLHGDAQQHPPSPSTLVRLPFGPQELPCSLDPTPPQAAAFATSPLRTVLPSQGTPAGTLLPHVSPLRMGRCLTDGSRPASPVDVLPQRQRSDPFRHTQRGGRHAEWSAGVTFGTGYFDSMPGAVEAERFLRKRGAVATAAALAAGMLPAQEPEQFMASHRCAQCRQHFAPALSGHQHYCSADCATTAAVMQGRGHLLAQGQGAKGV